MNILNKITDKNACKIADLACGYKEENEHEVIDRIFGIDVGLMGKYNEEQRVEFRCDNNTVIINYIDRRTEFSYKKIRNKNLIKKELRNLGISKIRFNNE